MKHRPRELNVDFIGGGRALNKEDEQAISDYFKQRKLSTKNSLKTSEPKKTKRSKLTT